MDFLCKIGILLLNMLKMLKIPDFLLKIPGFLGFFLKFLKFKDFPGFLCLNCQISDFSMFFKVSRESGDPVYMRRQHC